jgi:hypothetical protein
MGPFDFPITIDEYRVVVENVTLTGIFEQDYAYTGKGEFNGDLDLAFAAKLGFPPAGICDIAGGCQPCADDPDRLECIHLYVKNMRADAKVDPIVPIGAPTAQDLGETAPGEHTVEIELLHPVSGAPEAGIELLVEVIEGTSCLVNGGLQALVNTGAEGTVQVSVTDSDGGTDKLRISINVAPGYEHVYSILSVEF